MLTSRVAGHTLRAASHLGRRAADAVAFMRAVVRKHSSRLLERGNTSARTREGDATEEVPAVALGEGEPPVEGEGPSEAPASGVGE